MDRIRIYRAREAVNSLYPVVDRVTTDEKVSRAQDKYQNLINKFGFELADFMERFFGEILSELNSTESENGIAVEE